ncbi:MAG TPA: WXG100 family type VII secretion target [Pseudonocardia sp.]|jgi:WXG100 family type VII secretion target
MPAILVTFAAIESTRQHVTSTAQRMNQQLDELRQLVARLTAGWQGQAQEDYRAKQAQWDAAAADLNQVLGQIGVALGAAHEGYRNTENANAARWT